MERLPVTVVVERLQLHNRWGGERWQAIGVLPDFDPAPNAAPQRVFAGDDREHFRSGDLSLELFPDQAEGYFLNLSSPVPKVFVMLRLEADIARPVLVTASYAEGARLLDSGEQVDAVAMPLEIANWVGQFVNANYRPQASCKLRRSDPLAADRARRDLPS